MIRLLSLRSDPLIIVTQIRSVLTFTENVMVSFTTRSYTWLNKHKLLWTFSKNICMIVMYHGGWSNLVLHRAINDSGDFYAPGDRSFFLAMIVS